MFCEEEGDEVLSLVKKVNVLPEANRQLVNSIIDLLQSQGLERSSSKTNTA